MAPAVTAKINADANRVLAQPETRQRFSAIGIEPLSGVKPISKILYRRNPKLAQGDRRGGNPGRVKSKEISAFGFLGDANELRRGSRFVCFSSALALVSTVMPCPSIAAYPERPVRLIVPTPPGGGGDNVARHPRAEIERNSRAADRDRQSRRRRRQHRRD